jgi:cytoplasmic iron level regulating protein YaaA (DUF328/UPF0246 family)
VQPPYYLNDRSLLNHLYNIRNHIFQNPLASVGSKKTYAFDLYVRAGKAYKELFNTRYAQLKSALLSSNTIEFFFLSGGYGIIHALEAATKYQATFNQNIARKNNIPYTANLWSNTLPLILDDIISKLDPDWVYVFGSQDYTNFVKQTRAWISRPNIKIFESTRSAGPVWLSPIINECVDSILDNRLTTFNNKHPNKHVKQ